MKLVLVRHGQSIWNLENRFTGWTDVGLSEQGIKEAKEAGVKLAVGGKGMLLWQGAESYKLYTGLEMPTDEYQKFQAENEGK